MIDSRTRPRVVCICGSGKRFWDEMTRQRKKLTFAGKIVIGPEIRPDDFDGDFEGSPRKHELDALHFHKTNISDEVLIVDMDTSATSKPIHVGESTARELAYAKQMGIPVTRLSDLGTPHVNPPAPIPDAAPKTN